MRIAHLSAEVSPFAKTGGLGDVVGSLPKYQAALGHEVSVWMPLYRLAREDIARRGLRTEWVTDPFTIDLGYSHHEIGLLKTYLPGSEVPLFLVGQDRFFDRPSLYFADIHGKDDGVQRYGLFVRAVLEAMRRLQMVPDVLNAHDWHAALANMALEWDRPRDKRFARTVHLLTIHNLAYQGIAWDRGEFLNLGLPRDFFPAVLWDNGINLLKGGLLTAHAVTTVSPNYAWEITTPEGGFGLDSIVRWRRGDLFGIVNGVDTQIWNPATDPKIPFQYSRQDLRGKAGNRRFLLEQAGMDPNDPGLVVGAVGRLTIQKGYDLLFRALDELVNEGIRFILLGSGDDELEAQVRASTDMLRGRFWGYVGFDDSLAHLIEAGADAFLMPSRFEPCGLSQLYSLVYGTPPVVRRAGGLVDTVAPYMGGAPDGATGFGFDDPSPGALRDTVRWVNRCFKQPGLWNQLMLNGMAADVSWETSARQYLDLYQRVRRERGSA